MRAMGGFTAALMIIVVGIIAAQTSSPSMRSNDFGGAAPPASVAVDGAPRTRWAFLLAHHLGNDRPSPDIIAWIVAWQRAEGTGARHNPLATTQAMPGATLYNVVGVRNYPDESTGLRATVQTLHYSYPGYEDIREGVRANDPERAQRGLEASPWGTNAALVRRIYEERVAAPPATFCLENVRSAVEAIGGVIVLAPGDSWSFNEAVGRPNLVRYVACAGVPGGGWCNLAGRINYAARHLGLRTEFVPHRPPHNDPTPLDNVAIWNIDGQRGSFGGRLDLVVHHQGVDNRTVVILLDLDGRAVAYRE